MKKLLLHTMLLAAVTCLISCSDSTSPDDVIDPKLSTDSPDKIFFNPDGSGDVLSITVTTNQEKWDFVLDPADGWLTVERTGDVLELSAEVNPDRDNPRRAKITITAGKATPVIITAVQRAEDVIDPELSTDSPEEIFFNPDGSGDVLSITVTTNQEEWDFILDSEDEWLTVERTENVLELSANVNLDSNQRQATLTIMAGEAVPVVITATQLARTAPAFVLDGIDEGESFTITYIDASTESTTVNEGMLILSEQGATPKTIYSINSAGTGEILIGRLAESDINLKFRYRSDVDYRAADEDGNIPIGCYAELILMGSSFASRAGSYVQEADLDLLGGDNIDSSLTRYEWAPLGATFGEPFNGSYSGGGHVVSNLYIDSNYQGLGFFGYLSVGGLVKDLGIASGSVNGTDLYVGGICGYSGSSTITNCYNKASISGAKSYVAGICGHSSNSTITNCYNTGTIAGTAGYVGGVCALATTGTTVTDCRNEGAVSGSGAYVGGVLGAIDVGSSSATKLFNKGNVTNSGTYTGGVVGRNEGSLYGSRNEGAVSGEGSYTGGVAGYCRNAQIYACCNAGNVTGTGYVGGAIGYSATGGNITACYNNGSVTATGNYVGGVAGLMFAANTIKACYNTGLVKAASAVNKGNICGAYSTTVVENCFWLRHIGEGVPEYGVGNLTAPYDTGTEVFSGTVWPAGTTDGWGTGDGSADNTYWKQLGSWTAGGTPDGANSNFPKLYFE